MKTKHRPGGRYTNHKSKWGHYPSSTFAFTKGGRGASNRYPRQKVSVKKTGLEYANMYPRGHYIR